MTIVSAGPGGFRMNDALLNTGWNAIARSPTAVTSTGYEGIDAFTGAGFVFDSLGTPVDGLVTGWTRSAGAGEQIFSLRDLSIPLATIHNLMSSPATLSTSDYLAAADTTLKLLFSGADTMSGSDAVDVLWAGAGDDALSGGGGDDELRGGGGSDTIGGGSGNDAIQDEAGSNILRGDEGNDIVDGGVGFDDINGNQGADTCSGGGGDDWVVGGKDDDVLFGDRDFTGALAEGSDIVYGNLGNDTCDGGGGNDLVRGGQGDDSLTGGTGDDWLSGDLGNDTLSGGAGADVFHSFGGAGLDRVLGFNRAEGDRVQLDPGTSYAASQVGADVVIDMTGGGQMVLVGVSMASLADGWIFAA